MSEAEQAPGGLAARPRGWFARFATISICAAGFFGLLFAPEGRIEHWLPALLLRPGPFGGLRWKWLILPIGMSFAWGLGYQLSQLTRGLLMRMARRTSTHWDEAILAAIGAPLTLAWMLLPTYLLNSWLNLETGGHTIALRLLRAGLLFALVWGLSRAIAVLGQVLAQSSWVRTHAATQALGPFAGRVITAVIWVLGVVALLSELGYPVASLVAGLGIGGLAVALAAQKTVENLFGAFSIGADQPFREGDFVKIEDFVGTVESIGLRSTKIRTLDRTLISVPNGRLAEMRLESYTARDRMRLACTVGLVYDTGPAQLREILGGLERVLRAQPKIWPDAVVVRFKEFGDSSLNIEVMAWFETSDFSEFQLIRQEVLLQFMDVVKNAGSSFAFPTRTVQLQFS